MISANSRRFPFLFFLSLILIIAIFLSNALTHQNRTIIFILLSIIFVSLILRSNVISISLILFIIPFTDWAVEKEFIPMQIMWLPELLSLLIFIRVIIKSLVHKQRIRLFGIRVALFFLLVTFISLLYNGSNIIAALLFLRHLFRYYLLFLAIINLDLEQKSMKLINNVIIFIFILQLPISLLKLNIYGQGEESLGLSGTNMSTFLPLIAIGFLLSYYFLYKKSLLYILLALAFVGFGIIGGKRATVFFLLGVLVYFAWYLRRDFKNIFKYAVVGGLVFILSAYFAFRLIPTLNPQRTIWGEFDPIHALNFVYRYSMHTTDSGMPTGRAAATAFVFNELNERGIYGLSLGFGPGSILKSRFKAFDRRDMIRDKFELEYGLNGLNWLGLQVGYIGMIIYLLLFYLILRNSASYFRREVDPYWRAFGLGTVIFSFIMIFFGLFYSPAFINDALSSFYFCLAGFTIARFKYNKGSETSQIS